MTCYIIQHDTLQYITWHTCVTRRK